MPCPDVFEGSVVLPNEDYGHIQQSVDSGHNQWRLSPVRTAQVVGTEHLGLRPKDVYSFVEQYVEPGSGLQNAVVRVRHDTCVYLVQLYQPRRQGPRGIWVVSEVTELRDPPH
ncbi:hypothetical protein D2Q93_03975 [Alicyclobacillaceae bacterium I2511]|nr:hypothetical protein D2Q93_03975 [Alicyclobacillaceae bacterium I2511]